eukprot:TRINITY_DN12544_c0_g1_i1.p1 TRINITY_DN12544_c0_g1~~TRINITY_DN12544_c0_g1_i1.p1  ORF type:complete len:297 (+),score=42.24 TRINITY_DN12544_c0_g1_i1:157-1047(+)
MIDACSDGSTFGIAAAVIGGIGTLWAGISTYTLDFHVAQANGRDDSKWRFCPRLSTGGIVFSLVAALMAFISCWSYSDQRPATADFFLMRALNNYSIPVSTACNLTLNSNTQTANCSAFDELLDLSNCHQSVTGAIEADLTVNQSIGESIGHPSTCSANGTSFSCELMLDSSNTTALGNCTLDPPRLFLDTLDNSTAWVLMSVAGVVWIGSAILLAVARCYKQLLNPIKNKSALTRPLVNSELWAEGCHDSEDEKATRYQDSYPLKDLNDDPMESGDYNYGGSNYTDTDGKYEQLL